MSFIEFLLGKTWKEYYFHLMLLATFWWVRKCQDPYVKTSFHFRYLLESVSNLLQSCAGMFLTTYLRYLRLNVANLGLRLEEVAEDPQMTPQTQTPTPVLTQIAIQAVVCRMLRDFK
eukprot:6147088-Amphidinium_carterae.1